MWRILWINILKKTYAQCWNWAYELPWGNDDYHLSSSIRYGLYFVSLYIVRALIFESCNSGFFFLFHPKSQYTRSNIQRFVCLHSVWLLRLVYIYNEVSTLTERMCWCMKNLVNIFFKGHFLLPEKLLETSGSS